MPGLIHSTKKKQRPKQERGNTSSFQEYQQPAPAPAPVHSEQHEESIASILAATSFISKSHPLNASKETTPNRPSGIPPQKQRSLLSSFLHDTSGESSVGIGRFDDDENDVSDNDGDSDIDISLDSLSEFLPPAGGDGGNSSLVPSFYPNNNLNGPAMQRKELVLKLKKLERIYSRVVFGVLQGSFVLWAANATNVKVSIICGAKIMENYFARRKRGRKNFAFNLWANKAKRYGYAHLHESIYTRPNKRLINRCVACRESEASEE